MVPKHSIMVATIYREKGERQEIAFLDYIFTSQVGDMGPDIRI